MIKKIAVIIGSPYNILAKKGHLYDLIEEKTHTKFEKVSKYVYKIKTKNSSFYFYACYKPKRDKSYESSKKYFNSLGQDVPPPTEEVIKKIKGFDLILVFGTCGSLDGKKNHVYLPTKFYNIFFEETYIKHSEIQEIELDEPIKCQNILLKKINADKTKVVTSNITFIPDRVENNSKKHTKILVDAMKNKVDCVDMESYPIVEKFKGKIPIGIFLFSSDVVGKHKKMKFQLRKFQNVVSNIIKDFS